ncbi:single-stranded-DNA-specific exonuclease RecJ [Meiothermus ruber]|uniref:Single-stranded-DNA-specific exonuclease RecJ n=2 Tax=Meiothermus ruber TaxID=277 RepID=A0A806DGP5_MEIRD|nr:DHH family phosphoesterase [Meiothermus ruber]ADD27625.1 single-stranded-DNA-specific exonuclease RecJ [Meiothermus ruber DSM 1279]MCL6531140.1 DHH family phosphoesterase [Meiothermus ruber]GAO74554.1 single-stranded-DNA-specific exonuclease RecJ [Meiothermus ruber H328]GIW39389.1 MAG: single-stranded-DNA-specific exonuclease RecJ [Meiothermus sp.]
MKWRLREWPHVAELRPLIEQLGIPPLAAAVFWNRGFRRKEDLEPPLVCLPIDGLKQAALRIIEALEKRERIRVHGDYDADGLTGTALLLNGLERLGAEIHAFIPHRLEEGYGVLMDRVPEHLEACDLFITVDCGITNHAELRALVENGVSVLVTDHHSPGAAPPPGLVVHPALSPGLQGQAHPTGSGVAFLLLWQVYELLGRDPPLEYADLAAIGTVADVAPLQGFNRALVQEGLRRLRDSANLGLKVLAAEHCQEFSASEIAFRIAPRINAASRLGQAGIALELLTTQDVLQAGVLAERLTQLNVQRQRIEEAMLERIWPTLDPTHPALVIHDAEGHPGVMGIVASRVLERYYKPVFIIAEGKGSVRSTPGISAVGALQSARAYLERFGGHAQAAGFAIRESQIPAFTEAIHRYAAQFPVPEPEIVLDGWLDGEDLDELHRALQLLEPLGEGNPEPLFYTQGRPEYVRTMGEGKHLSFRLNGVRVVKWRDNGERLPEALELAAGLALNRWNGEQSIELRAQAYRPLTAAPPSGWAIPLPLAEAVRQAIAQAARVYVHPEGAGWFIERGALVVKPEEAEYWFSLPTQPAHPRRVYIALSEKALRALEAAPDPLVQALGRRVATAYRLGLAAQLAESLERYWQAL